MLIVGLLAGLALVVAGTSLLVSMSKSSPSSATASPTPSCRTVAWNALPPGDTLPEGWTVSGSGFYTDGYGAQLTGPTASGAQAAPVLNVRVSCYGSDGHIVLTRSHEADLAAGGTDVPFAGIGDEALAAKDASGTTTSVYFRRGQLVASLAAQGVTSDDLDQVAGAIDDAMLAAGETAALDNPTAEPGATDEPAASDEGAIPSDAGASDAPEPLTHTFPALEAILPDAIDGTPLTHESSTATDVMSGDPSADALFQWLTDNGKTSDQLEFATAYDANSTIDASLTAIRVNGIAAAKLRDELIKTWLSGSGSAATTSTKKIGGKTVTVVDYHDQGSPDYIVDHGDAVIIVASSDPALAEKVVASIK